MVAPPGEFTLLPVTSYSTIFRGIILSATVISKRASPVANSLTGGSTTDLLASEISKIPTSLISSPWVVTENTPGEG